MCSSQRRRSPFRHSVWFFYGQHTQTAPQLDQPEQGTWIQQPKSHISTHFPDNETLVVFKINLIPVSLYTKIKFFKDNVQSKAHSFFLDYQVNKRCVELISCQQERTAGTEYHYSLLTSSCRYWEHHFFQLSLRSPTPWTTSVTKAKLHARIYTERYINAGKHYWNSVWILLPDARRFNLSPLCHYQNPQIMVKEHQWIDQSLET